MTPPPAPAPLPPPAEPGDGGAAESTAYLLERYAPYMSAAVRAEWQATPAAERFDRFSARLLAWERREALLAPHRGRLSPLEIERYRALPDVEASARFLEERAREPRRD